MKNNDFINVHLTPQRLDVFHIRSSIFSSLKKNLPLFQGKLLDIGCGKMPYKQFVLNNSEVRKYVGLDLYSAKVYDSNVEPDFRWDGVEMPFSNNSFETIMGTEVLEHCPSPEITLSETFRVLKTEGYFFFTVPFLWNLHEIPYDEYRYTPFALERLLKEAGFTDVSIEPHGGWHASLAQMMGLWARRAPMNKRKRKLISRMILPIIKFLLKNDQKHDWSFEKPIMITGLSGIARKPK